MYGRGCRLRAAVVYMNLKFRGRVELNLSMQVPHQQIPKTMLKDCGDCNRSKSSDRLQSKAIIPGRLQGLEGELTACKRAAGHGFTPESSEVRSRPWNFRRGTE